MIEFYFNILTTKIDMKKHSVILLMVLLATSCFFYSCNNKMQPDTGKFVFDSLQVDRTEHLFGDTAKPSCNIRINLTSITGSDNENLKDSVNCYVLSLCLGEKYINQTPAEAIKNYVEAYVTNYRKDLEPMYQQESKEDTASIGAWYSYYKGIEGHVQFYHKDLLVYRMDYNEYTGGAHGIYMTTYLNLNLATLTPIRLDDLFVPNYKEALTDLLWNQLMADNHVATHEELEDMGYTSTGELVPTENFCLNPDGITFHYNIYEIAPYVMGAIQITLPYDALSHLLNDETFLQNNVKK